MAHRILGTIETELFDTSETKPHFINPGCFGEDLAEWLRQQISSLAQDGFSVKAPIQEDFGWGFQVTRGKSSFYVALSFVGDGPVDGPAEWIVMLAHGTGLLARLLGKADPAGLEQVAQQIGSTLEAAEGITWLGQGS